MTGLRLYINRSEGETICGRRNWSSFQLIWVSSPHESKIGVKVIKVMTDLMTIAMMVMTRAFPIALWHHRRWWWCWWRSWWWWWWRRELLLGFLASSLCLRSRSAVIGTHLFRQTHCWLMTAPLNFDLNFMMKTKLTAKKKQNLRDRWKNWWNFVYRQTIEEVVAQRYTRQMLGVSLSDTTDDRIGCI